MMELPEELVARHLEDGGFFGAFNNRAGEPQPAPVVQYFQFREDRLGSDDRCIFIRQVGDSSIYPSLLQVNEIVVGFVTKADELDMFTGRYQAEQMYQYVVANFEQRNMHSINPIERPAIPHILESGRMVFQMTLSTQIGRSEVEDDRRARSRAVLQPYLTFGWEYPQAFTTFDEAINRDWPQS